MTLQRQLSGSRHLKLRKQGFIVLISASIYSFIIYSVITNNFKLTVSNALTDKGGNIIFPFRAWNEGYKRNNETAVYDVGGSHTQMKALRHLFNYNYNKNLRGLGKDDISSKDSYLIYRCDDQTMTHCGGSTDRFKGMMVAYILANLTGRTFKAEIMSHKCNFLDFFVPNRINWSLPVPFHKKVVNSTDTVITDKINDKNFYISLKSTDFKSFWPDTARYVYFKANLDYMDGFQASLHHHSQLSWMDRLTRDQINSVIFRRLIKLSPRLQERMNDFMKRAVPNPDDKLVCAHVRMGKNPSIPKDFVIRNKPYVLPRVWDFLTLWAAKPNHKIFFTSDSQQVVEWAKTNVSENILLVNGDIHHIERTEGVGDGDICRSQAKVVLEQFILMHCDVLMISKSGFSRLAAYVRGSNDNLHCLVGTDVIPCKLESLKELYSEIG